MSILREIQNEAINSKSDLAQLLRKCKYLSYRLNTQEFKEWIDSELNGYTELKQLPAYRKIQVNSKGHFAGAYGSGLQNADIPLLCVPEKYRESLQFSYFFQPVSSLESLIKSAETANNSTFQEQWDPDLVVHLRSKFYENMLCYHAWKVIPANIVASILDTIRTRILNFALEIETLDPDVGEAELKATTLPSERVNQIFNTTINGNVQNLSNASSDVIQTASITYTENLKQFDDILEKLSGLEKNVNGLEELIGIVNDLKRNVGTPQYATTYNSFMSILSNHIAVFGPILAPFLPHLSKFIT